jgi:hypothetical protein
MTLGLIYFMYIRAIGRSIGEAARKVRAEQPGLNAAR